MIPRRPTVGRGKGVQAIGTTLFSFSTCMHYLFHNIDRGQDRNIFHYMAFDIVKVGLRYYFF